MKKHSVYGHVRYREFDHGFLGKISKLETKIEPDETKRNLKKERRMMDSRKSQVKITKYSRKHQKKESSSELQDFCA